MFDFEVMVCRLFDVDLSTKTPLLMWHVDHHLINLICLHSRSSEGNEMLHKYFKCLYKTTNNHIDGISPQLLTSWFYHSAQCDNHVDSDTGSDDNI